jgi:hypothetical protein
MNNPANETGAIRQVTENLSKTYKEVVNEFVNNGSLKSAEEIVGAMSFAEYLDRNNVLTNELTLLALQQSRKIDREFMKLLIDAVGIEKATVLARQITENHRHTKVCQEEVVPVSAEQKSESVPSETNESQEK